MRDLTGGGHLLSCLNASRVDVYASWFSPVKLPVRWLEIGMKPHELWTRDYFIQGNTIHEDVKQTKKTHAQNERGAKIKPQAQRWPWNCGTSDESCPWMHVWRLQGRNQFAMTRHFIGRSTWAERKFPDVSPIASSQDEKWQRERKERERKEERERKGKEGRNQVWSCSC